MAQPAITTVTVDGQKFNALSASVSFATASDQSGMPQMGSLSCGIDVVVDIHDNQNMPFGTLKKLFELANVVTRDKIKDMKIEYWQDEKQQDAICSYAFKGWISHWHTSSGGNGSTNHVLSMSLQPAINSQNFSELRISN
ncbi:MAG TPA: hypothetical protein VKR60_00365 [Candidatus Sulfotelmatobacter sp.]|nr:hypothetical protein [Candidatus Sulfotelmatobacter sp.]